MFGNAKKFEEINRRLKDLGNQLIRLRFHALEQKGFDYNWRNRHSIHPLAQGMNAISAMLSSGRHWTAVDEDTLERLEDMAEEIYRQKENSKWIAKMREEFEAGFEGEPE